MSDKHTPGKWIVLDAGGDDWSRLPLPLSEYVKIGRVGDFDIVAEGRETEGMDEANSCLIASALELKAQRDELLENLRRIAKGEFWTWGAMRDYAQCAVALAEGGDTE